MTQMEIHTHHLMSLDQQHSTVLHSGHVLENAGAHCMFSSSAAYLPTSEQKALKDFSNINIPQGSIFFVSYFVGYKPVQKRDWSFCPSCYYFIFWRVFPGSSSDK